VSRDEIDLSAKVGTGQLTAFICVLCCRDADQLQELLRVWYAGMKVKMKRSVEAAVLLRHPYIDAAVAEVVPVDSQDVVEVSQPGQEIYCPDKSCVVSGVTLAGDRYPLVLHRGHRPEDAVADFLRHHLPDARGRGDEVEFLEQAILSKLCGQLEDLVTKAPDAVTQCDGQPAREVLVSARFNGWPMKYLPIRRGYGLEHYTAMLCTQWDLTTPRQRALKGVKIAVAIFDLLLGQHPELATDPDVRDSSQPDMAALFEDLLFPLSMYAYRRASVHAPVRLGDQELRLTVLPNQRPEDALGDFLHRHAELLGGLEQTAEVYSTLLALLCPQMQNIAPLAVQCSDGKRGEVVYQLDIGVATLLVRVGYTTDFYVYAVCALLQCDMELQRQTEAALQKLATVRWSGNSVGAPRGAPGSRDRLPTLGHMSVTFGRNMQTRVMKLHAHMRPEDMFADFVLQYGAEAGVDNDEGALEDLRLRVMHHFCPTVRKRRATLLHLLECDGRDSSRLLLTANLSAVLPTECQDYPLVPVRFGYTIVTLRSWVGDQLSCRGDKSNPRSHLEAAVITAAEEAVMRAVWGVLGNRAAVLDLVEDCSAEDLALLGRLYDSLPVAGQTGFMSDTLTSTAPGGTESDLGLGMRADCLVPLSGGGGVHAALCVDSAVVVVTAVAIPTGDDHQTSDELFVLFSDQRLADAVADFVFRHQRRVADKQVVFQGVLDRLCPLLQEAQDLLIDTSKLVVSCDGANEKSPLVVSVDLSAALPGIIYPWLHMRTLYSIQFYTTVVCTELRCGALRALQVEAIISREYHLAMALREERHRHCNLSNRVELLGESTQVSRVHVYRVVWRLLLMY